MLPTSSSDYTEIAPLHWFNIDLHMLRPRPIPCWFYSVGDFNFPNILNNLNWSDFFIPIPESITSKISILLSMLKSRLILIEPLFVNFSALDIRLIRIYFIRRWSENTIDGTFGV